MTMWISRSIVHSPQSTVPARVYCGPWTVDHGLKDMAFPGRLVFAPFVVVVGSRYFFPVPECLLSWSENLLQL